MHMRAVDLRVKLIKERKEDIFFYGETPFCETRKEKSPRAR